MNDTQSSCNSLLCVGEKAVGVNPSDTIVTKSPISVSHQVLPRKVYYLSFYCYSPLQVKPGHILLLKLNLLIVII